jgi:hypothetical protein
MVIQLALILVAEQDERMDSVLVRVFVSDSSPMPSYGTELLVPWPKPENLRPTQPVVVPVALNVPCTVKRPGRHALEVFFDYDGSPRRSVPFSVMVD